MGRSKDPDENAEILYKFACLDKVRKVVPRSYIPLRALCMWRELGLYCNDITDEDREYLHRGKMLSPSEYERKKEEIAFEKAACQWFMDNGYFVVEDKYYERCSDSLKFQNIGVIAHIRGVPADSLDPDHLITS